MLELVQPAREQKALRAQVCRTDPVPECIPGLLGNLELYRALGLLLHHHRPRGDLVSMGDVSYSQLDQIAPPQLAVDRQVEQRKVAQGLRELQSYADGPDLLQLQRRFLANKLPLVPGVALDGVRGGGRVHDELPRVKGISVWIAGGGATGGRDAAKAVVSANQADV